VSLWRPFALVAGGGGGGGGGRAQEAAASADPMGRACDQRVRAGGD